MRRGSPLAAALSVAAAAATAALLQGALPSAGVRSLASPAAAARVLAWGGPTPPAFLAGGGAPLGPACRPGRLSRSAGRPLPLLTAAAAPAPAPAPAGGETAAGGTPAGCLSARLDEAADGQLREQLAAAAAEGDGIVCISSKDEQQAVEAAAAAAAGGAATLEGLSQAARAFEAAALQPGASRAGAPGVPLTLKPGGPLEALSLAMRGGLEKAGSWLRRWKLGEERIVPILLSKLEENAAVSLGQKTVIQLPESQRLPFVEAMKYLKAAAVVLGYADADEAPGAPSAARGVAPPAAAKAAAAEADAENIVLVGFAAVAEPIDVRLLDSSGEVGLKIVGRVKILGVQEANERGFTVRAVPWWDERRAFANPSAVRETLGALHSLSDRCNKLELRFRQLQGRFQQAHLVSLRASLGSVVSELLADLENPSESEIAEVVSFCAMDHHLDARTRCWANSQQDSEMRLDVVRRALEAKVAKLQAEIRALKATQGGLDAAAAAGGAAIPHPAAPLGIHQELPEDVYAGPPTTFG